MKWIGLTGGIASGKSTVAQLLREQGYPVVDADILAREVIEPGTSGFKELIVEFGSEILNNSGEIDRQKLGSIVFSNKNKLNQLESVIHPLIRKLQAQKRHELSQAGVELAFYDVPLLYEKELEDQFDEVVVVYSSKAHQIKRMEERDELTLQQIESRLSHQMSIDEKKIKADHVIHNEGDIAELKVEVLKILNKLTS